jgi:hypothetical protein
VDIILKNSYLAHNTSLDCRPNASIGAMSMRASPPRNGITKG